MIYHYTFYIIPLGLSALISLSLAFYALLRKRMTKGSVCFVLCMVLTTIWSFSNAMEMSGADIATKLFWANMQYFSYCYLPVAFLLLVMEFTGHDKWAQSRWIMWLALIPTVILCLAWTDGSLGLIRQDFRMVYNGMFYVLDKEYNPLFYLHSIYSHCLLLLSLLILLAAIRRKKNVYTKQAISLLAGMSLIELPSLIYLSRIIPGLTFDMTPLLIGGAGLIIAWGIFRYRMFDVVPVAWGKILESIDAGILVLDEEERIVDVNPAFEKIVGQFESELSARKLSSVCEKFPELVKACEDKTAVRFEFTERKAGEEYEYEVYQSPLTTKKGMQVGRLLIFYDITEKKHAERLYMKQQWQLAVKEERERMGRDLHDNLGQVLGFINLQAQGIRQELENAGIGLVKERLDRLAEVSQAAHTDIRNYIRSIREPVYSEDSFILALNKIIVAFEEISGIAVRPALPASFTGEEIQPGVRIHLLNIIREALNNIRKYALAQNVQITISHESGEWRVTVEDDGIGFAGRVQQPDGMSGYGLEIMRERAAEIGGRLEIETAEGRGSRITVCAPAGGKESSHGSESDAGR